MRHINEIVSNTTDLIDNNVLKSIGELLMRVIESAPDRYERFPQSITNYNKLFLGECTPCSIGLSRKKDNLVLLDIDFVNDFNDITLNGYHFSVAGITYPKDFIKILGIKLRPNASFLSNVFNKGIITKDEIDGTFGEGKFSYLNQKASDENILIWNDYLIIKNKIGLTDRTRLAEIFERIDCPDEIFNKFQDEFIKITGRKEEFYKNISKNHADLIKTEKKLLDQKEIGTLIMALLIPAIVGTLIGYHFFGLVINVLYTGLSFSVLAAIIIIFMIYRIKGYQFTKYAEETISLFLLSYSLIYVWLFLMIHNELEMALTAMYMIYGLTIVLFYIINRLKTKHSRSSPVTAIHVIIPIGGLTEVWIFIVPSIMYSFIASIGISCILLAGWFVHNKNKDIRYEYMQKLVTGEKKPEWHGWLGNVKQSDIHPRAKRFKEYEFILGRKGLKFTPQKKEGLLFKNWPDREKHEWKRGSFSVTIELEKKTH